jgi:hypothetical protein
MPGSEPSGSTAKPKLGRPAIPVPREVTCRPVRADVMDHEPNHQVLPEPHRYPLSRSRPISAALGTAASATSLLSPDSLVTICGHRRQAATPSCAHQRHLLLTAHGGAIETTTGTRSTILLTRPHLWSAKWAQPLSAHGAANLKTSSGETGSARSRTAGVTGTTSLRYPMRAPASAAVRTPKISAPACSGRALGHHGVASEGPASPSEAHATVAPPVNPGWGS